MPLINPLTDLPSSIRGVGRQGTPLLSAVPAPRMALPTPYLSLDPAVAARRYGELTDALPDSAIHYTVRANSHPEVLRTLGDLGARFDVASPNEVTLALDAGADPRHLLYSTPIRRRSDLASAYAAGVRMFVVDCLSELHKVADEAPGSAVLCRLLTSVASIDRSPPSPRYGCSLEACVEILDAAADLGLDVAGVAFEVGAGRSNSDSWRRPIEDAARIFWRLRRRGHRPWLLDLGDGFPADHDGPHALASYGEAIGRHLRESFGDDAPQTAIEAGPAVIAQAGILVSTVVAVCWRGGQRWVYLDASVGTRVVDPTQRIGTSADGGPTGPVVLAGPTPDDTDIRYDAEAPPMLPMDLREGDTVRLHCAGAYTAGSPGIGFDRFEPLPTQLARGFS